MARWKEDDRTSVLYIDLDPKFWTNPDSIREYSNRMKTIEDSLQEKYHTNSDYNLLFFDKRRAGMYDILLTHVQMFQNGIWMEYTAGLRELNRLHERYPQLPIIILTGAIEEHLSDEDLLKNGAMYIIRKNPNGCNYKELEHIKACVDDVAERIIMERKREKLASKKQ